jgi:hypothetical protein
MQGDPVQGCMGGRAARGYTQTIENFSAGNVTIETIGITESVIDVVNQYIYIYFIMRLM